jgi:hypothetical protein
VAEWSKAAVLKTAVGVSPPQVRILSHPLSSRFVSLRRQNPARTVIGFDDTSAQIQLSEHLRAGVRLGSDQRKTKTGAEADALFAQASEKLLAAEGLVTGSGAYNLACIAALRGQPDECRHWLQRSHAAGRVPSRQHLMADDDLRSVRDEPWFAELLSAARDEAG